MKVSRSNIIGGIILSAAAAALVSCATWHAKKKSAKEKPTEKTAAVVPAPATASETAKTEWKAGMKRMAGTLVRLMPYTFSREEFSRPTNQREIKQLIHAFADGIKGVPQHAGEKLLGEDPIVGFAIQRLQSNVHEADVAYNEGHLEFARNVLRESMGLCFSCHTASDFGPQNGFQHVRLISNFHIYPSERANFYVATRQFDRAVSVLEGVLKTPGALMDDPHEALEALRKYLEIEVRVKKDPARAASVVENFLAQKDLPYFVASDGEMWLKSLREWKREKPSRNEKTLLSRALSLVKKGRQLQAGDSYEGGYVDFLRASSLLHECLRSAKNAKEKARIYQLLGTSYNTVAESSLWDLPIFYFEACIRTAPKTLIAKVCYRDFERALILGYSGSAGIFVPKEEQERMTELRSLAGL